MQSFKGAFIKRCSEICSKLMAKCDFHADAKGYLQNLDSGYGPRP